MAYSNREIAKAFANGETYARTNHGTMFIDGNIIYSYGRHYPIAVRNGPKVAYVNSDKFSATTSKQSGYVRSALIGAGFELVEMPTSNLKAFI